MNAIETGVLERLIHVRWDGKNRTWIVRWVVESLRPTCEAQFFTMRWSLNQLNTPAKAAQRFCFLNKRELADSAANAAGESTAVGLVSESDSRGNPVVWVFVAAEKVALSSRRTQTESIPGNSGVT